ncbi:7780_t:CDS:2 [Paraglomus brasilianum]|uniref:7780_t:CDS:1 n=1 Tax=Paraglomus brasilianum TaxID=144538 RepID=A0A9N9F646_9GLOM|nr:7780_t:CDS:2 [Paraglomus brasilianum]
MSTSEWKPPGKGDLRSPCPALNILANHGYLPHDGKNLSAAQITEALNKHLNVSRGFANFMARMAVYLVGSKGVCSLEDFGKHNVIEHDASLTRQDASLGNNIKVDPSLVDDLLSHAVDGRITIDTLAKFRNIRYEDSLERNKDCCFGMKQRKTAYGESALLLSVLGQATNQEVDVETAKVILKEERLPDGWQKGSGQVTFCDVWKLQSKIEKRSDEMKNEKKDS